jgi:glycosyltransferase involved in cell wall biosynthesis
VRLAVPFSPDVSGASRAALNLLQGLTRLGVSSELLCGDKSGEYDALPVQSFRTPRAGSSAGRQLFGWDVQGVELLAREAMRPSRLLHLHQVALGFGVLVARAASLRRPIVATIHDVSLFTGGCLVLEGCDGYRTGCEQCPQIGTRWPLALPVPTTRRQFLQMRKLFADSATAVVAPSLWVSQQARLGALVDARIVVIPNAVGSEFEYLDQQEARSFFGLEQGATVVGFVANDVLSPHKGLLAALPVFEAFCKAVPDARLMLAGHLSPGFQWPEWLAPRVIHIGHVRKAAELRRFYAACSVLWTPSTSDNSPCVVQEAGACGTPTISWDVGALPELVGPTLSGVSLRRGDVAGMVGALGHFSNLSADERQKLSSRYLDRFGCSGVAAQHVALYETLAPDMHA